jgi:hypothetical protein
LRFFRLIYRGGVRFVEEPQLPPIGFTESLAAAGEKPPLQPSQLFAQDVDSFGELNALPLQFGILLPQLRNLAHQRFDAPLHGSQSSTAQ